MQIPTHKSIYICKQTKILINKIKQSIVKCVHTHTNANTLIRLCAYKHTIPIKNTYTKARMHACSWPSDSMVKNLPKSGTPTKGPPEKETTPLSRLFLKPFLLHFFWNFSCYIFSETFPVSVTFCETFPTTLFLKPCLLHFFSNLSSYTFSQTFPVTHFLKPCLLQFHVNEPLVDFF